jgi:hypothetical protein
MSSDEWRNVVEQEQRAREQRMAQDKYHGTQEMYHLEQGAAREGQFHGEPVEAASLGFLGKLVRKIKGIVRRR